MVIGSLVTNVVADLSRWGPNLTKARGQMAAFVRSIKTWHGVVTGIVAGSIAAIIKSAAAQGDALGDMAVRLNTTVEDLQKMRRAADQLGGSAGAFDRSLAAMNKQLGMAQTGAGAAAEQLQRLGLNVDQLTQMRADQAFVSIAGAINGLSTATEQAAAAQALFGRSGSELLPVIRAGTEEIRRQADGMKFFVTAAEAARLELVNKRVEVAQGMWETFKMKAVSSFVEGMEGAMLLPKTTIPLPAMPVRQPRLPGRSELPVLQAALPQTRVTEVQQAAMKSSAEMQGRLMASAFVGKVVNSLPGPLAGMLGKQLGIALPESVASAFEMAGKFIGQTGGLPGLIAGQFGRGSAMAGVGIAGLGGPRIPALEALGANTREGRLAITENLRPRGHDPQQKMAKNSDTQVKQGASLVTGVNALVDLAKKGGDILGF